MQLTSLDWIVVALYFALNLGIGFYFRSRAGSSLSEYFLSGRDVPWWLAGTSMVATTFAADTPLAVTGLVARGGIAGNWLWWNFLAGGMLTVFFYARLWRRSGVMTDIEFTEIRYSGKPAAFLRGFRALYLGIPINCIVLGWVNLAMVKIVRMIFGVDKTTALMYVMGMIAITAMISALSGLWGVLVTDSIQFVIKQGMVIALAVAAVRAVGGLDALQTKLVAAGSRARCSISRRISIRHSRRFSRSRSTSASCGGPPGIRALSPAAAASSRNACSPPATRSIRCWPPSGSTSPISRSGRGRGFSRRSRSSSFIPTCSDPAAIPSPATCA